MLHEKLDRCERPAVDPGPRLDASCTAVKVAELYCRMGTSSAGRQRIRKRSARPEDPGSWGWHFGRTVAALGVRWQHFDHQIRRSRIPSPKSKI